MRRVTIWDLDYYYAEDKKNKFNPDAMKISSYHKQKGDQINFVLKKEDIRRPYDIYYVIKENSATPNPPVDFFTNSRILWWGTAFRIKKNWKMPDEMIICRPDYLLYPNHETAVEKSEQVRFFNNEGKLIERKQDWTNSFTNKYVIITDRNFWTAEDSNEIIAALDEAQSFKRVSFFEPIWMQKILSNKIIREKFLTLDLSKGANLKWLPLPLDKTKEAFELIKELKEKHPSTDMGVLTFDYKDKKSSHWDSRENALKDFNNLIELILWAKKEKIKINIKMPRNRFETPYFLLFEELSIWTADYFKYSWIEYITRRYGYIKSFDAALSYWNHPEKWSEVFRDLLRQTYENADLIMSQWGDRDLSVNDIPWNLWKEEFKYGI